MSYNNYQQGYGQPPNQQGPNNGHQHDVYGQQQQYGAPPSQPSYGDPTLHYAAPPQQYGAPPPQQYGAPPPQQYGAPPPQQYGAPLSQQYGAPPSQQYGAPPSQQYGAPPSQQYGAPPSQQYAAPQQQYGAPQQQYGASTLTSGQLQQPQAPYGQQPPYGQQQQYGQQQSIPPSNGYTYAQQGPLQPSYPAAAQQAGCFFLGVAIPPPPPALPLTQLPGYDPAFDSDRVRKATKGFGTDERALIDVLTPLDAFKMELLSRTYEGLVGRSLQQTLEKELSGWLENGLVLLSLGPLKGDLHLLHRACAGAGTHEDLLSELLINRSNQEIWMLKEGYQRMYHKDLVGVVKGELSMKTERMFIMALAGTRDENPMVDQGMVQRDVQSLHSAGVGKIGTDEIKICGILQQRSDAHMHELARAYQAAHKIKLSDMVHREFSGHMQDALIFLVKYFEGSGRGIERDADMLHDAMAGMGTKDERLVWRIVRGHWNKQRWQEVKMLYQTKYRNSLERAVKGETTGKYERLLVQLIE